MALIKCPFCGAMVSDKAPSCIKCHNSLSNTTAVSSTATNPTATNPTSTSPTATNPTVTYPTATYPTGTGSDTVMPQGSDTGKSSPIKVLIIVTICVLVGYMIFVFTRYGEFRDTNNNAIKGYNNSKEYNNEKKQHLLSRINGLENVMNKAKRYATSKYSDYYDSDDYADLYTDYRKYGTSVYRYYFDPMYNRESNSVLYRELSKEYSDLLEQYSDKATQVVEDETAVLDTERKQSWSFFKWFFDSEYWIGVLIILLLPIVIGMIIKAVSDKQNNQYYP